MVHFIQEFRSPCDQISNLVLITLSWYSSLEAFSCGHCEESSDWLDREVNHKGLVFLLNFNIASVALKELVTYSTGERLEFVIEVRLGCCQLIDKTVDIKAFENSTQK